MPKLNAILMVVLTAAVLAATGFLVLGNRSDGSAETARRARLLRKLADPDPDLRRDAESEIRALGPQGAVLLREAARSAEPALAERAAKLLRAIAPPDAPAPKAEEVRAAAAPVPDALEFRIECAETVLTRGEPVRFYVRLINSSPNAVVLYRGAGPRRYAGFAVFEVTDPDGQVSLLPPEPEALPQGGINPVPVEEGKAFDLYAGQADGRTSLLLPAEKPGTYRVRFVWDATEGSAYRKIYDPTCAGGHPLPPQRIGSNTLALHLGD